MGERRRRRDRTSSSFVYPSRQEGQSTFVPLSLKRSSLGYLRDKSVKKKEKKEKKRKKSKKKGRGNYQPGEFTSLGFMGHIIHFPLVFFIALCVPDHKIAAGGKGE